MLYDVIDNKRIVNASIILMGLSLLTFIMYQFQSFLIPFTVAIILTFLFMPAYRLFQKKKRYKVYVGLFFIAITVLIIFLTTLLADETEGIDMDSTTSIVDQLGVVETRGFEFGSFSISFADLLQSSQLKSGIQNVTSSLFSAIGDFLSQFAIIILFLVFMLPSHDMLVKNMSRKLKGTSRKTFKETLGKIEQGIRDYLVIKSLVSAITAGISLVVLLVFGVQSPILFTLLIFIMNFIPNIGSFIAVGAVLIVHFFAIGFTVNFILVLILLIVIQVAMGNIIEPKMSGKKMNISPIVILLSLFFWGFLWGVWGMFFAVPLTVVIKIILENVTISSADDE